MKKVLVITYYWPPSGGAGVQRWLKFTKYLPEHGIEPVILTVSPGFAAYPQIDESLLKDVPTGIKVYTSESSTGIFSTYKKLTRRKEIPYGGFVNESDPGITQKILRFVRGNFFLPDARKGWNRYAVAAALQIIKDQNIDTVITTSPPHSTQLIGLKLKKLAGIKWIADLRDPWTDIYYSDKMFQTLPAKRINEKMEIRVLNNADMVVATCDTTRDVFRSKVKVNREKVITITNGFDPGDFTFGNITPDRFTITYLGTLAGNYDINVLVKAIDKFISAGDAEICLRFIGKTDGKAVSGLREKERITLELLPYINHARAMEYLSASAALLLVIPSDKKTNEMIPGKLFEYLAARRAVISLGPGESDAGKILNETSGGRSFVNDEVNQLSRYLTELYNRFKEGRFITDSSGIEKYSRKYLSGKYSGIIKNISVNSAEN